MATRRPEFHSVGPYFTVPNVVAAAKYYCNVLGFENRGFFGSPPMLVRLSRGPVEFYFGHSPYVTEVVPSRSDFGYDAYIHVTGLNALAAELAKRGAKIVEGPIRRVYGMRELVVVDCHGLRLAFGEDPGGVG